MGRFVSLFLLFFVTKSFSQDQNAKKINGKILSEMSNLEGIYIINLKTEKATITDKEGYFSIDAIAGDSLLFSATQFKRIRLVLKNEDFCNGLFFVKMHPIFNILKEVIVKRYYKINSVSLGIIPKGQKSYTEAERKLYSATDLNVQPNIGGMSGGSISADPLINFFSGRTKMLKKELEIEKKITFMSKLDRLFTLDYFVNTLKIPNQYVNGFKYYAVDNEKFTTILAANNNAITSFLIGELAHKYIQIIACEN